jgi:Ras-related protein Rab-28
VKRFELPGHSNIALQIWDIGGQNINGNALSTYIYGSDAIVLIYDITNYDSFVNLAEWLDVCRNSVGDKQPHYALIGNKTDLFHM